MKYLLSSIILCLFITACSPYKNISYVRNIEQTDTLWPKNKPDYRLQPNDVLYIRIIVTDKEINTLYNPVMGESGSMGSTATRGGMYLYGYNITDSGTVAVPPLGTFKVNGLTLQETEKMLQHETDKTLTNAMVIVKLAEFKVTFLGEVNNPGRIIVQTGQLNILEGIGEAGDIPYTGKRRNVLVIRQEEKGVRSYTVNLTDPKLVASAGYYLMPNDIVIVKPTFIRALRVNLQDYFIVVGSIGSTIATAILLSKLKL